MTASWKTFLHDRGRGWLAELVIEEANTAALWPAVDQALGQLEARGYAPLDPYAAPIAARVAANLAGQLPREAGGNGGEPPPTCPIHDVRMERYEKEGRSWYAHRLAGSGWCNGKPGKVTSGNGQGVLHPDYGG